MRLYGIYALIWNLCDELNKFLIQIFEIRNHENHGLTLVAGKRQVRGYLGRTLRFCGVTTTTGKSLR